MLVVISEIIRLRLDHLRDREPEVIENLCQRRHLPIFDHSGCYSAWQWPKEGQSFAVLSLRLFGQRGMIEDDFYVPECRAQCAIGPNTSRMAFRITQQKEWRH